MGQITTGIGLMSGLNIADIVDQLIQIDSRPKTLIENRNAVLQSQLAAFQEINARLLSLRTSSSTFVTSRTFQSTKATSSNEAVLTASSTTSATQGTYSFTVDKLVTSQQTITRGFANSDYSPIGSGSLTFEKADARLDTDTRLGMLNGGSGVNRGYIRITDRSGESAIVDLTRAITVDDVLESINGTTGISVLATVDGDAIKVTDLTGQVVNDLSIANVGSTSTATGLGIAGTSGGTDEITGTQINSVGLNTVLSWLNDGNGVRTEVGVNDITIQKGDLSGSFSVDLDDAVTIDDVIDLINDNTDNGGDIVASLNDDGTGIKLTDNTGGGANFTVTAANGSNAGVDLGIIGDDTDGDGVIEGSRLIASLNSKMIKNLNGGSGVSSGSIDITNRLGNTATVDLSSAISIVDVIDAINDSGLAGITASLNQAGNGVRITDTSATTGDLIIAEVGVGTTATELNIEGTFSDGVADSGNLQLQYITEATRLDDLGVQRGKFKITLSNGQTGTVDLTQGNEQTIGDVLSEINSRFGGGLINARINDNGDGILIEDLASGALAMKVEEVGSSTASDLGIKGEADAVGGNIDGSFEKTIAYTSDQMTVDEITGDVTTLLSALNNGDGVDYSASYADFKITTQDGSTYDIDIDGTHTTVQDIIDEIETTTGGDVTVALNSFKSALVLTDNTTGNGTFKIEALNSSTAAEDLGIEKTDNDDNGQISGSSIVESTTLEDLAEAINDAEINVIATVINDGSPGTPYRLSITSRDSGTQGAFIVDDIDSATGESGGFNASTLSEASDAVVFYGSSNPATAMVITSSSNTLDSVVPGLTVDLLSTSDQPVNVTVAKDTEKVTSAVSKFVEDFNALVGVFDKHDSYDTETEEKGLLLGDSTVSLVRQMVYNAIQGSNTELTSQYTNLVQVGITVGTGAKLKFDAAKFNEAYATDPEAVESLFTYRQVITDEVTGEKSFGTVGIGVEIDELLKDITDSVDGVITRRTDAIDDQIELNEKRIEDLVDILADKRARYESEFYAMEQALAQLNSQSSALTQLQNLASSWSKNSSKSSSSSIG